MFAKNYKYALLENDVGEKTKRNQRYLYRICFYIPLLMLCIIYYSNKVSVIYNSKFFMTTTVPESGKLNNISTESLSTEANESEMFTTPFEEESSTESSTDSSTKQLNSIKGSSKTLNYSEIESNITDNIVVIKSVIYNSKFYTTTTVPGSRKLNNTSISTESLFTEANESEMITTPFEEESSTESSIDSSKKQLNSKKESSKTLNYSEIENNSTDNINAIKSSADISSTIAYSELSTDSSTKQRNTKKVSMLTSTTPSEKFNVTPKSTTKLFLANNSSTTLLKAPTTPIQLNVSLHQNVSQTNSTKSLKSMQNTKYFVETKTCRIPWVDPFTSAIKKMFHPQSYKPCSKKKSWVSSSFDNELQRYILNINLNDIERNQTSCCYKEIIRSGKGNNADKDYKLLPCAVFHQNFVVPEHIDGMIVECKSLKPDKVIQKDAFAFIQKRNSTETTANPNSLKRKPSVLLIGIDTLSSFNFRRNMPKTFKFLKENGFFELEGYNKVGDNTFPNLMPLLAGLNATQVYKKCNPTVAGGLDKCNFLWKMFKAHGYKTAYAEDGGFLSTFNYLKKGFLKQPTDFYLRPFTLAIEKNLPGEKKNGLLYCLGFKKYGEYIYDFGIDFAKRFRNEPKFGLFWTNSFSHNNYATSSSMDFKMQEYMNKTKMEGILDDAITIFLSDHGCRWGPLLDLPEGFLEERLPMFFISLPKWFQAEYPDFVKALQINKNRLATHFDVHQTLKHILSLGTQAQNESQIQPAESCSTAQSIFYVINETRTCNDACIPEHYCTCEPYEILSVKNSEVKKISQLIVNEINKYLKESNLSSLCHELTIEKINDARVKIGLQDSMNNTETLRIKFRARPKSASFEATAVYDMINQKINVNVNDISRHDSYAPHSKCIDNKIAKKFCICKH